jgi:cbb3-type cytochrome oxidase cytochrome c subunit
LSNIGTRLSADQLYNKTAYPKKSNPGSSMPSFSTLPNDEMQSLIRYMQTLR